MMHTISALVANKPGVLADMAEAFGKLQLNITSISSGETENPDIARMVIRVEADDEQVKAVTETMQSMDMVLRIDDLSRSEFVDRELVMVKVAVDLETTSRIMQILEVFRATVIGIGQTTMTAEMTGDRDRVEGLIKMLTPFGIKSMCRTGTIALTRGDE